MPFEVTQENLSALMPLYKPWQEPTSHRLPNRRPGGPAEVHPGRRPSKVPLVRSIRADVDRWRRGGYAGVSATSRTLLNYWFNAEHEVSDGEGGTIPFRYHWAQREAIETVIYLYELRNVRRVAELLLESDIEEIAELALGINPEDDRWSRNCCKVATGGGKTKVMSLAIVWSYFHRLYEMGSDLAQHFVIVAPNLTVYERLQDDFEDCAIFHNDPLIPEEWKGDFQVQVVLQDEPGGASSTGAIYLTNIHRLYGSRDEENGSGNDGNGAGSIFGPPVQAARALDTGAALRERITSHPRLLVLNDEAHHLHDPELAWNRAIDYLHSQSLNKGNGGICLQLDFTATPKHNDGTLFRHIVCDFPLGEAVDAGIVKVPVLGESDQLQERGGDHTPAHVRYGMHLKIGYERYARSYDEWHMTRKPILFVMTEDAQAANEIANHLDSDDFPLLKGRVLNIHTRLKGRIKTVTRGGRQFSEFVESEKGMKPDDLRALREMSRELDAKDSKFRCVVSVMMLREGWDVRNVTTIVPLRPYTAKSGILPEQTLGRGLRRMAPHAEIPEMVTVVHHPAFRKLYEEELAQEGFDIAVMPVQDVMGQSVSIFVDETKPVEELDIALPRVTDAIESAADLEGLTFDEVRRSFQSRFQPLPVGGRREGPVEYKERVLFTDEIFLRMKLEVGLLTNAWSAPNYFAQELGRACRISNPNPVLTPLIEEFISKVLFEREVNLFGGEVDHRMRDPDVMEHIRATFTPLISARTVRKSQRKRTSQSTALSSWKPFQATSTPKRPAVPGQRSLFNLTPCDNAFEQEFADFCDYAEDVTAFAKNAGPQKLMIDYLKPDGQRGLYWPDFFVRLEDGSHYLVELKGREDPLVPIKARAAIEWCKTASTGAVKWTYVYVPYALFQQSAATGMEDLARACTPALQQLVQEARTGQLALALDAATAEQQAEELFTRVLREAGISAAPAAVESTIRQAVQLLDFGIRTKMPDFAAAFQPLLAPYDEYAYRLIEKKLKPRMPADQRALRDYFSPSLVTLNRREQSLIEKNQRYLERNLVYGQSMQRLGTLLFCLDYARQGGWGVGGVWADVQRGFGGPALGDLYAALEKVNQFRNTRVAHVETKLDNPDEAWQAMRGWLVCLTMLVAA